MRTTKPRSKSTHAGRTLLELCLALGILAGLAALGLAFLLHYQEQAEKTAMDLTIRNIRSGLRLELAERMIQGKPVDAAVLLAGNPVQWLQRPPSGYVGELSGPAIARAPAGSWFFDAEARELAYVPRLSFQLEREIDDRPLRWRVRGRPAADGHGIEDVNLVAITPYHWF